MGKAQPIEAERGLGWNGERLLTLALSSAEEERVGTTETGIRNACLRLHKKSCSKCAIFTDSTVKHAEKNPEKKVFSKTKQARHHLSPSLSPAGAAEREKPKTFARAGIFAASPVMKPRP